MKKPLLLFTVLSVILIKCGESSSNDDIHVSSDSKDNKRSSSPLFQRVASDRSGLDFQNTITETQEYNYFTFQYAYNGGGVAVGDLDNDGLPDVYFTGNQVPDRLYRNKGDLSFEDITETAGIDYQGGFNFGVCMVDINQDGWQDIYVCRSGHAGLDEERANLLFINNGDLTFTESAEAFGLADRGYSIHSAFFDMDKDGDLDMYLTNHPVDYGQNLKERLDRMKSPEYEVSDRLYRNNGDNTFTDVSLKAGIQNYGHGLGLAIWDINGDGWDDIYVGNDYQSADYVYINNQDGSFTDRLTEYFPHIPYYSMGVDVGDINNDGLLDLNVVEMLPSDYERKIRNLSEVPERNYYIFNKVGFHHQYTRNGLFLNRANTSYSDIAPLAGVEATDWSWTCLLADYDQDGLQDLFVTNGYLRDMQDRDYISKSRGIRDSGGKMDKQTFDRITVSQKLRNHLYSNNGDLTFSDISLLSGLEDLLFSSGAAHADMDGDGDLDLIVNNTNLQLSPDPAILYENLSDRPEQTVRFHFKGNNGNLDGEGCRVSALHESGSIVRELRRSRGFMSGMDKELIIGLGESASLSDVQVRWPDGSVNLIGEVSGGSTLVVEQSEARQTEEEHSPSHWAESQTIQSIDFEHREAVLNEYDREKQLPFRMSMQGPQCAVADVDGNGEDDLFICGSAGQSDALYLQVNGSFRLSSGPWSQYSSEEHSVARFCDVDMDGDQDLYLGGGTSEFGKNDPKLLDRLFVNESGAFRYESQALPRMMESTSVICFGDIDGDGDPDAFVGSRSVPFDYGAKPHSFLLINDGTGRFTSSASEYSPAILELGMVSDAVWTDKDGDEDMDLVIVGEWAEPVFLENTNGRLNKTDSPPRLSGLWRSINAADLNGDGMEDLILGNIGNNSMYNVSESNPLILFKGVFDTEGNSNLLISYKQGNTQHPDRSFTFLKEQFPGLKSRFSSYEAYAKSDLQGIFGDVLEKAERFEVSELRSMVLWNSSTGYGPQALSNEAQISSVNIIFPSDVDGDGDLDLLIAGNELYMPIHIGSHDAGVGLVLMNEGNKVFKPMGSMENGAFLKGWIKDIQPIVIGGKSLLVATRNNDRPLFIQPNPGLSTGL